MNCAREINSIIIQVMSSHKTATAVFKETGLFSSSQVPEVYYRRVAHLCVTENVLLYIRRIYLQCIAFLRVFTFRESLRNNSLMPSFVMKMNFSNLMNCLS